MKVSTTLLLAITLSVSVVSAAPIPHSVSVRMDAADFDDSIDGPGAGSRVQIRSEKLPALADSFDGQSHRLMGVQPTPPKEASSGLKDDPKSLYYVGHLSVRSEAQPALAVQPATPKKARSGLKDQPNSLYYVGHLSVRSEGEPALADNFDGQLARLMVDRHSSK